MKYRYSSVKRAGDFLIALCVLCGTAWFLLPCMLILWCTGEHYIFYRQKRRGKDGKPFFIIKFATMLLDSPNMKGGTITTRNDPRVLPFGKYLRKTKINELPQIFNVLNGTMSIVGPRPLSEEGFHCYSEEMRNRIYRILPGITGLGSLIFRDEEKYLSREKDPKAFYREKIIPYKGALELYYQEHMSLATDCKIIFLTAWIILFPASRLPQKMFRALPEPPDWL